MSHKIQGKFSIYSPQKKRSVVPLQPHSPTKARSPPIRGRKLPPWQGRAGVGLLTITNPSGFLPSPLNRGEYIGSLIGELASGALRQASAGILRGWWRRQPPLAPQNNSPYQGRNTPSLTREGWGGFVDDYKPLWLSAISPYQGRK